ncbi:MAG: RNA polymerase-binding protein DksA, partial [Nisaea sp.]
MSVTLPPDYTPSEDEEFMSSKQQAYFRQKLLKWRAELLHEANETLSHLTQENLQKPDMADRASLETDH